MRLVTQLTVGFLGIVLLVVVLGYVGLETTNTLKEEISIVEASKSMLINIKASHAALHEHLLTDDPTERTMIRERHHELSDLGKMWLDTLGHGSSTDEFRATDSYSVWVRHGMEYKMVTIPLRPAISEKVEALHELLDDIEMTGNATMDLNDEELSLQTRFDKYAQEEKGKRYKIDESIEASGDMGLHKHLDSVKYHSKEALYQYRNQHHGDEWLADIDALNAAIASSSLYTPEDVRDLTASIDDYRALAGSMVDITLAIEDKRVEEAVRLVVVKGYIAQLDEALRDKEMVVMDSVKAAEERAYMVFMASAALCILLVTSIALHTTRHISRPVIKLRDAAARIASGDLETDVPIGSDDEIGQLADAFNEMTMKLKGSYEGLERKVAERTQELEAEVVERTRAEEALRDMAAFAQNNPSPVMRVGDDGTILMSNTSATKICRIEREDMKVHECLPTLTRTTLKKIKAGSPLQFEQRLDERDFFFTVIEHALSSSYYLYGSDITGRRKAEVEIRKLARAVEHSPASVVITDPDGTIEYVNPKFVELTGYISEEVIGKNPRIMKSGEQPPAFYKELRETITAGKTWRGEFHNRKKNGEFYWEAASISPVMNEAGEVTHFVAVKEDVTERKRAEEVLRRRTHDLGERVKELNCLYGISRLVAHKEATLESILQGTVDLIPASWQYPEITRARITLDDRTFATKGFKRSKWRLTSEIIVNGELRGTVEVCYGKNMPALDEGPFIKEERALIDAIGERLGRIIERLEIEDELHKYRKHLETLVKERTANLQASLDEKDVLLKEVHHRVKNNLQVVSSLLSLQSGKVADEEALAMFTESRDRVRSMALIHESLYRSTDLASIDFRDYVGKLVPTVVHNYGIAAGVDLRMDIVDVRLGIDQAVPCGLIVNELVTNALKHAFPKGRKGTISISLTKGKKGTLTLEVANDGVPIPEGEDILNKGTLGIQLVRTLTGQLDGTIELERKGGTTFRITFPYARLKKGMKKEE